ncbi:MAG: aldo/keto reductase [Campylobacterales bacterium]|nr:aldo/keto reductase [Campylobacterales bacterium]
MRMPRMIYGTAWKKERTAALVYAAVKAGFRGIDTACQPKHYHEAGVGEALKRLFDEGMARDELYIQTKFTPLEGHDPKRIPYDPKAPLHVQVAQSYEVSKHNLGIERIDALVLHSPLFPYRDLLEVWRAMESLEGVGQLGISNCYDPPLLQRLYSDARIKPAVVQNRFYDQSGYDAALRQWCDTNGVLYQSFWSLTANPHLLASDAVQEAARLRGVSPAQIFYAFLIAQGITPLNGTTSEAHMRDDLGVFEIALTFKEMEEIGGLLGG